MNTKILRTAECVSLAHPDKVCDQISDLILDECLKQDPFSRSGVEALGGHGTIFITGELTTNAKVDFEAIAKKAYRACGYEEEIKVIENIAEQSNEIALGVDQDGAGDQGIMVGYATNETPEMMPLEYSLARRLVRSMGIHDAKAQVTIDSEGKITNMITSLSNNGKMDDVTLDRVVEEIKRDYTLDGSLEGKWFRNPNGSWEISGFAADAGMTGRKVVVDHYGPHIPVGGGAFSGKDATKVDRSAAYMARKIAVDTLHSKGANKVLVHIAYAIGVSEPTMALINIDGVEEKITGYDLKPSAIIERLDLRSPVFYKTARDGHFGNGYIWDTPGK